MQALETRIRARIALHRCRYCTAPYSCSDVHILARRERHWMVLVACEHCERQAILFASIPPSARASAHEAPAVPAASERPAASTDEPASPSAAAVAESPSPSAPISAEDVAGMRAFLQRFDGDFQRLFH